MDPRLQGLAAQLGLHSRLFLNCLDGVSEDAAAVRPSRTNNMAFIAAHLVDARHWLARSVGLALDNPFAERLAAARGIDDLDDCPSVAEARGAWTALARPLEEHLGTLPASVLDQPSPQRFPVSDTSVLGAIAFLAHHEAYHIGQLALLRRYVGWPAMRYR